MIYLKHIRSIIPALALIMVGALSAGNASLEEETIYDVMLEHDEIETFATITTESEMHRHLHHDGPFTVLAPTDEALDALPADELGDVMQDEGAQRDLMNDHMFQGEHTAEEVEHVIQDGEVIEEITAENGVLLIVDGIAESAEE